MRERVTLATVADRARVSKGTASKVFNGRPDVSSTTRERVHRAAEELGYAPAARLTPVATTQVWVTFAGFEGAYAGTVLDGLLAEAHAHDAVVPLARWGGAAEHSPRPATPEWIRRAQQRGASAFILITTPVTETHVQACAARGTPLVVIDPASPAPEGALTVAATNWRGGVQATEHLIDLGHRSIAFIGAPLESMPGHERLAGFRSALDSAGLAAEPQHVRAGEFAYEDGLAAMDLLRRPDRPTAVFAACDATALGVLEAAHRAGLRVPEDLSVVGFDDSFVAPWSSPHLTTVRQPLMDMGRLALRTAVSAIADPGSVTPHVELATSLVLRDSTGPAPGRSSG